MVSNRAVFLFFLVLILAILTNWLIDQDSGFEPPALIAKNDPDVYILNADITQFNATGERQHKIIAERLTHFPLTDTTTLTNPNITLYATLKERKPWNISARHGRVLPKVQLREEIVELWDQVLAVQEEDDGSFVTIRTDSLTIYPEKDYAETDQQVTIDNNSGTTTAGGMKAHFAESKFIFFRSAQQRVESTYAQPATDSFTEQNALD